MAETFANPMTTQMMIFISSMVRKVAMKLKGPKDIRTLTGTAIVRAKTWICAKEKAQEKDFLKRIELKPEYGSKTSFFSHDKANYLQKCQSRGKT